MPSPPLSTIRPDLAPSAGSRQTPASVETLEWLIIGGGIHGTHIAARLIGDGVATPRSIRILDPGTRLLDRWRTCTQATGMTHLRSSEVHHLDLDYGGLRLFAGRRKGRVRRPFVPPFNRPSLGLFNDHCDQVDRRFGLSDLHVRGFAQRCTLVPEGLRIQATGDVDLTTKRLVLALGASEQPEWPTWAPRNDPGVHHLFDREFDQWPTPRERVLIVGGGITAAHLALRLLDEGHEVTLVSRHPLRHHQFDSDPGWLGEYYASRFQRSASADHRRSLITAARHTGSVPPDLGRRLRRAIARRGLRWHEGDVTSLDRTDHELRIRLAQEEVLTADRVLLATGFSPRRPGGAMLDRLIDDAELPCAACGFPIVDAHLRWHPRIFVSGPLAELELGPVSRNIAGARWAAERIVSAARGEHAARPGLRHPLEHPVKA